MKRELGSLAGEPDLDSPRMKRRKELPAPQEATVPTGESSMITNGSDGDAILQDTEGSSVDAGVLKDQATKLWQTVKDAVNKEGNICSPAFMRLPSKRHYPDYYNVITNPICLDDIKKKIDEDKYSSLDDVRQDFELCFSNAKRYNMKDSPIWLDAKFLLKLTNKEYTKLTGKKVKKSSDHDENGEEKAEGDGDDDKKKNKPPNMNRLLKSRLQKLVEKTDEETHRVLSDVFMEMPSKKDYPSYYKQIKRPMCLEYIFKRLKRKEYATSEEFANEVELVFSNALEFNQDHSQIWEDASTLRDYFRQLMSDLPPPHALHRYAKTPGKIKLKVPGVSTGPTIAASQLPAELSGTKPIQDNVASSLTLRLPGSGTAAKSPVQMLESLPKTTLNPVVTPAAGAPVNQPLAPKPAPTPTPVSATLAPIETSRVPTPVPTPATPATVSSSKVNASSSQVAVQPPPRYTPIPQYTHYPNATYHPATQPLATPKPSGSAAPSAAPINHLRNAHSVSRSPAPSLSGHRPLKEVLVSVKPRGRSIWLDHRDGVRSWAIKLGHGEISISLSIAEIKFLGDEDRDSSDEDADAHDLEEEEEEVPKKRGRGRPPKNSKVKAKVVTAKKSDFAGKKTLKAATPTRESIQIVLNGKPVGEKPEQEGVWDMDLQTGMNVLEVGEKGGHVWKVYFERVATT
ncbi:Bromodomain-containing protein [Butyriboletus roseoflavus]|nr:Bromodomain-containing protein [Butyriboletus roseoflavus]